MPEKLDRGSIEDEDVTYVFQSSLLDAATLASTSPA
jgi:hypothetical protein